MKKLCLIRTENFVLGKDDQQYENGVWNKTYAVEPAEYEDRNWRCYRHSINKFYSLL